MHKLKSVLEKMVLMKNESVRASVIVAVILLAVVLVRADDKPTPRLITVTGEAEINVAPDEVVFDVSVQTINKDLRQAKAQTDECLKRLMELTRKYKIAPQDVQTDYIKLEPRYRGGDESRLFIGYSVRKDLVFKLRDVTQAEGLLAEVLESGITRINSIRFQTSRLRAFKDQARSLAIKAAQEKAIALTREIGQTIGKAYSIEEEVPERGNSSANFMANSTSTVDSDSVNTEGTLSLGQIKISARVTVRFELN
jgi:uncharacterized protein YggE